MEDKLYVSHLEFSWEGASLEEAEGAAQKIIQCAKEQGMTLIGGSTAVSRERDPVELIHHGGEPFMNLLAREQDREREETAR